MRNSSERKENLLNFLYYSEDFGTFTVFQVIDPYIYNIFQKVLTMYNENIFCTALANGVCGFTTIGTIISLVQEKNVEFPPTHNHSVRIW
jgi:hypothetical protein